MTVFKQLYQACGLSSQEAAEFLNVRLDTVKSWSSGRRNPPDKVLNALKNLLNLILKNSSETVIFLQEFVKKNGAPEVIDLFVAKDNRDAIKRGFPFASCQRQCYVHVIANWADKNQKFRFA